MSTYSLQSDTINISLAFFEGIALIISPCILAILSIILPASLEGNRSHPYGIILGFILFFSLFTFFSKTLVYRLDIDLKLIRTISYGLLLLFGIIMFSNYLTEKFTLLTKRLAHLSMKKARQEGFINGFIFGGLVGIIWTPCAGPILAAALIQTILQKTNLTTFLILLSFSIGAGAPMLIITLFGRKLMTKFRFVHKHHHLWRKILGSIIIASVLYMIQNDINTLAYAAQSDEHPSSVSLIHGLQNPYPAPPIQGIEAWINSKPLQLSNLRGKVILLDFWTYTCINCVHTIPYLNDWYRKYHNQGFIIIGLHGPSFEYEKNVTDVKNAVKKFGIDFPVALDNDFVTWNNYQNKYWPGFYLIDKKGNVVYERYGAGGYDQLESNIRLLLGL